MKIALAQINSKVGDIDGNLVKIVDFINQARAEKADLVIFPELAITGYPPEDLLLKAQFISDNLEALKEIKWDSKGVGVVVGFVDRKDGKLYNAAALFADGKLLGIYHKMNLPNYGVFDEKRYFTAGTKPLVVNFKGQKIGLGICEDIWQAGDPYASEIKKKVDLLINLNASPYHQGKINERETIIKKLALKARAAVVYVNAVGGQDELIFDGGSMVIDANGKITARAPQFKEYLLKDGELVPKLDTLEEVYEALKLGTADYVAKNGFREVVVGLSGGIDSALTLAIAADALGPSAVHAIFMPSEFTAQQSQDDALAVAKNLGVDLGTVGIKDLLTQYLKDVSPQFEGKAADITEENLQARIRGNILMALSNKFGWLVLTTGNKSEMSVGYCTLYGDMAGGFAVIKDVPKTLIYKLAEWRNKSKEIIPQSIIVRPPTAELKPNQTDQDTLPPYEVLDPIMKYYVENNLSVAQIVKKGFEQKVVEKIISMIDRAEYKRRQAPPGPRISSRAFGKDWRVPITK